MTCKYIEMRSLTYAKIVFISENIAFLFILMQNQASLYIKGILYMQSIFHFISIQVTDAPKIIVLAVFLKS